MRKFSDPNVVHVAGAVNPSEDQQTINLELTFADLALIEKRRADVEAKARSGDAESAVQLKIFQKARAALDAGTLLSRITWTEDEGALLRPMQLLTMKPMLYVLNVDEGEATKETSGYLPISAKIEAELSEMPPEEAQEYLISMGLSSTGLDRLIVASYKLLGLITFFTAGPKEAHAWTLKNGATAPEAAGVVHSDFQKGFIRAEIARWQDIVELGGETGAKAKGKVRTEGKDYIMQDGDVAYFLASA
ncbi:MAG: GTP-binding protein YchF [Parcubacteria group bacterium GW2011_GWA2_48_9]|nr:MAG: GTP-binding protein YchF [Parcubacteria group bacterium GW2011_GWA2_48_9]